MLALVRLRRGEESLACDAAAEAARLIAHRPPMGVWTREGYEAVAEVYLTLRERGHAQSVHPARRACAALRQFARVFPVAEPSAGIHEGWAARLDGRAARSMRIWRSALDTAQRLGMPAEESRLHYEIGRHLSDNDAARLQHLQRASPMFHEFGSTFDLARTREALA